MYRHLNARYPRGDVRYVSTLDEEIENAKKVTLEEARSFYTQFYGVGEGEIALSGQFDPAQIQKLVGELSATGRARPDMSASPIRTPFDADKPEDRDARQAERIFLASMSTQDTDEDPDYRGAPHRRICFRRLTQFPRIPDAFASKKA